MKAATLGELADQYDEVARLLRSAAADPDDAAYLIVLDRARRLADVLSDYLDDWVRRA